MNDIKSAIMHLKDHQKYPASKDELVKTCMDLKDFSDEDKKWFMDNLPDKTYNSAEEVIRALGWRKTTSDKGEEMWMQA